MKTITILGNRENRRPVNEETNQTLIDACKDDPALRLSLPNWPHFPQVTGEDDAVDALAELLEAEGYTIK